MARLNPDYGKLAAGYLFPEIARRTKAYQEKNPKVKVMRLGIGNTTEPLTSTIVTGLCKGAVDLGHADTYSGYGDEWGNKDLRAAIAEKYKREHPSIDLHPSEIFVSDGAKPDSANLQQMFDRKAKVAVQDPAYPVYVDSNVMAGRTGTFDKKTNRYRGLVYMPCTEANEFIPQPPKQKVDLIYLCSPNNPTGAVMSMDDLLGFVKYARKNKSVIIFDAAYGAYVWDKMLPTSIYQVPGADKCAIEVNSFSKDAGFTGVRLGWSVIPNNLVAEGTKPGDVNKAWLARQTRHFNGASNIAQAGGLAALSKKGRKECANLVDYYMENAARIKKTLINKGLTVYGGRNAPYVWLKTPKKMKSWDFFDKLLNEAHVVGTPGVGFGPCGEGFFRLSAFGHAADVKEACKSIEDKLKI